MPLPRASRVIEPAPVQQLHRHVNSIAVAVEVEHGDDVRVRERLRFARFALQSHERLRMTLEIRVQHLERDAWIRIARFFLAAVDRAEHEAHAAFTEQFLEDEALLDDRARLERAVVAFTCVFERADQAIRQHLRPVRTGERSRRRLQCWRVRGARPWTGQRLRVSALRSRRRSLQCAGSGLRDVRAQGLDRCVRIDGGRRHHLGRCTHDCLFVIFRRRRGRRRRRCVRRRTHERRLVCG
jgi:hypothetical protein